MNINALLIDGNYALNRAMHVPALMKLTGPRGELTGGVYGLLQTLEKLQRIAPANRVTVVFDGGRSARRLALFPQDKQAGTGYKANRGVLPSMTPAEQEEKRNFLQAVEFQIEQVIPLLKGLGCNVIRVPDREADDVISLLVQMLSHDSMESQNISLCVATDDSDYLQLVSQRCCLYRPLAEKWVVWSNFVELAGYPVDWAALAKAIEGDTSDNIPGVPGVGEKSVQGIVQCFVQDKYLRSSTANPAPSLEQLHAWYTAHALYGYYPWENLDEFFSYCGANKSKRIQKIAGARDIVLRNLELVDLRREQFSDAERGDIWQQWWSRQQFHEPTVVHYLTNLGMRSTLETFAQFSRSFVPLW